MLWSKELIKRLLDAYKKFPCLWENRGRNFKTNALRNKAYDELVKVCQAEIPNIDRNGVVKKIQALKNALVKRMKETYGDNHEIIEAIRKGNISFLDLTDVDDLEQEEILSSLHSANSNVQLPWTPKTTTTKPTKTHEIVGNHPENGVPVTSDQIIHQNDEYHQPIPPQQQPLLSHHHQQQPPNTSIYPDHVNFTMHQQPLLLYTAPPPPPNYHHHHHHHMIMNNVPFATSIPVLTTSPAYINTTYMTTCPNPTNGPNPCFYQEQQTNQIYVTEHYNPVPITIANPVSTTNPLLSSTITTTSTTTTLTEVPQENGLIEKNGDVDDYKNNNSNGNTSPTVVANKSWASLFNSTKTESLVVDDNIIRYGAVNDPNKLENKAVNHKQIDNNLCPIKHPKRAQFTDPNCYRMGEFLMKHNVDGRTISLQPRGLINRSNYCYINSILQALLACPPVYNLLSGLSKQNTSIQKEKSTPIIDGMCRFVKEFHHLPANQRVNRRNDKTHKKDHITIDYDPPFEPSWIYRILNGVRTDSFLVEGRQEDAEEFLGCLLNGLNDEMLELMKLVKTNNDNDFDEVIINNNNNNNSVDDGGDDSDVVNNDKEWQVMGPKNKGAITRQTDFVKTPISDIFGGSLKSRIHRAGDQSTYNIQPFFTLQLNIEKVKTVREALEALVSKNQLEGVTSSKTNEEVEAWQQVTLEELPVILVLHLKCFDFKLNGCTKILKALEFPVDLKIDSKLLSKPAGQKEKQYKLFAVVYHDGKEATKGHYVTDAFHVGYSSWIRYDDSTVKTVPEETVLKPQGTRVPYLLFYRRSDTIRSK